jgi:hypothetical protein
MLFPMLIFKPIFQPIKSNQIGGNNLIEAHAAGFIARFARSLRASLGF